MKRASSGTAAYTSPRAIVEDRCAPIILEQIIRAYEPYLEQTAGNIASDIPSVVADMVQEARIALWELDVGRLAQGDAAYVERILCNRMIDFFEAERRGGLTTGWSKHSKRQPVVGSRAMVSS
jgi:DNA-directed RNA polymerase specialized sigma24 family protein